MKHTAFFFYLLPIIQKLGLLLLVISIVFLIFLLLRKKYTIKKIVLTIITGIIAVSFIFIPTLIFTTLEKVDDIVRDPNDIPPPIARTVTERVKIDLELKEVIGEMTDGTPLIYWTYNGTVPGPFLRVREGDTVELTLKNPLSNQDPHNIDLHAVNGPGGGATVTNVLPGESKTFTFKALNPGLYVYHCAFPSAAIHMAHGLYGLILVEPKEGLPPVDKEFYVMQGEFYSNGLFGNRGYQFFDIQGMRKSSPSFIVFNGKVGALTENMKVNVGDKVRIFFGNGGVNLVSSFHVIGEIFDTVYPEASIGGALFKNVQTTMVPAGGATIVEFTTEVPGKYILVDHALARFDFGAFGVIEVLGNENKAVFDGVKSEMYGH